MKYIEFGVLVNIVYGALLYWAIKKQSKINKKNILINLKTGIRFKFIRACWLYDEKEQVVYGASLLYKLDDKDNSLEGLPVVIKNSFLSEKYITLEKKEEEERNGFNRNKC